MNSRFFGQYLLEKGRITSSQLITALEQQKTVQAAIGTLALERHLLTAEKIKQILNQQRKTGLRFGEQAVAMGSLTQAQVDELLQVQEVSHRVLLGEVLVMKGYLTIEMLEKELKEYKKADADISSEVSDALSKLVHKNLVKTFTDLMIMTFTQFAKQNIKIERCEMGKDKVRLFRWVILQKITGSNVDFKYLLSVPAKLLLQMASTMLNDNIKTVNELALDATKEFVNIANGNACARLSEDGMTFTMLPPEVYETTTKPYALQASEVVCVHLASAEFKLEVAFEF